MCEGKNISEAPKIVAEEHERNFPHRMEIRMDSDINVNTCLSWIILRTENSEEWLVVATRSSFMSKNPIHDRFDPVVVPILPIILGLLWGRLEGTTL